MDFSEIVEKYNGLYPEFVNCVLVTYAQEDPETRAKEDLRDAKAKQIVAGEAVLWLEPANFAAVFSRGLAIDQSKIWVILEAAQHLEFDPPKAAERLRELLAQGHAPLIAMSGHPAEKALGALVESLTEDDGGAEKAEMYITAFVLLFRAERDRDVQQLVWNPEHERRNG